MTTGEALRKRVRQTLRDQPYPTVTVLSSLLAVQDDMGYLTEEAIQEVARFTGTTINEVWSVASFYLNFRFTPPGDHTVEVCWGPACHLRGAQTLLHDILGQLGLSGEGETGDSHISLKLNTCLGACTQAPVISVDHGLMGRMDSERALKAIQGASHPRRRERRHSREVR
ncbi:MAG: NAD(P)H-dependent oxidoreductase subunit E [Chloroflexi bacterium]|nr:NAD(P)H-dependent oxidoreductase subunit E [Chloroflexota bacterium]